MRRYLVVANQTLGISRWLHQDVVHRIRPAHQLPVTHIEAVHEPV